MAAFKRRPSPNCVTKSPCADGFMWKLTCLSNHLAHQQAGICPCRCHRKFCSQEILRLQHNFQKKFCSSAEHSCNNFWRKNATARKFCRSVKKNVEKEGICISSPVSCLFKFFNVYIVHLFEHFLASSKVDHNSVVAFFVWSMRVMTSKSFAQKKKEKLVLIISTSLYVFQCGLWWLWQAICCVLRAQPPVFKLENQTALPLNLWHKGP